VDIRQGIVKHQYSLIAMIDDFYGINLAYSYEEYKKHNKYWVFQVNEEP